MAKEIQQIIQKINSLAPDEKAVLATVVDVRGSSYRLPGAKMLILESGETFGIISGGCLEADVLERAKKVLRTGEPEIFTYDTTDDENSVFSLNMGCRGIVRILLESIKNNEYLDLLQNSFTNREKSVAATLISSTTSEKIGARFLFDKNGTKYSDEQMERRIFEDARQVLADERSRLQSYEFGEVFFEFIAPPLSLVIFGAGADAIPLAETAKNLGWQISVIDHREAFLSMERFPFADHLFLNKSEKIPDKISFDDQTAAVIMTHNFERDRPILANLLKTEAFYIGALGPKRRTEKLLNELNESGENFTAEQLKKLFAPAGLDIGADTPEAIALSIAAEIQSVLKNRHGGFLREREGSIYGRD